MPIEPGETLPILPIGPNTHEKHKVTKKALNTLEKIMLKQDDYGFEKYQKALKHQMNYDWLEMFLEELADGLKYLQNEMDRKEMIISILEWGLEQDNPKDFIKDALQLLKTKGTGK